MATTARAAEKVTDLLQNLKVDPGRGGSIEVSSNPDASIQNATLEASVADVTNIPVAYETGMDAGMYYTVNGFAAPHGYYYGGFECAMGDWDDYMRHVSTDGAESQNLRVQGVYNENGSMLYHPASYGYGPQHLYGPYTPGAPIPPMRADGQFYAPQGYPYTGHVYQPLVPPNAPFVPPSSAPAGIAAQTAGTGESTSDGLAGTTVSGNSGSSGARISHVVHSSGPTGRGILPVSVPVSGSQDVRAGPPWLNYPKVREVQPKHGLSQAIPVSGQSVRPVAPLMPHIPSGHHYRPPPAVAATPGPLGRPFQPSARMHCGAIAPGRAADILRTSGLKPRGSAHNWISFDKGKPWGRGNVMMSNGSSSMDVLNEQNRGPRTTRMRNRVTPSAVRYMPEQGVTNGPPEPVTTLANKDHYNHPDFTTNYDNAKCFIIKSYSEDDIHKSIKYGVWASTANGNKKLDAAYQEAQASSGYCPLFLFFSVNASGQFCGVAEMVGPVDFNKSLDFWQQDKWSGKLPVKWHIVKDVPNNQFRHIILENNDNKPVTNSRDTQEVRFDQGLEMLNIFKDFVFKTSILDDFQFYENRQKAMQEKRARQQAYFQLQRVAYRDNKDLEQRSSREDAPSTLQKGGRPDEPVGQSEKAVKLKDGHAGSVTADECNAIPVEEKRARQKAYLQLQQVVFRESKDLQRKPSREDALGILKKGGKPDEAVEKPVKLKDGRVGSSVSEKCNGFSSDKARLDRSLSRSDSRDSQASGVESLLSTKDTVSVSAKGIGELSG